MLAGDAIEERIRVAGEVGSETKGVRVRIVSGERGGRPFVRIDNRLGPADYCVRVSPSQAGELARILEKASQVGEAGPQAEGVQRG